MHQSGKLLMRLAVKIILMLIIILSTTILGYLVISIFLSQQIFGDQVQIGNYGKARDIFWSELYSSGGRDLYCGSLFKGKEGMNIEHIYAASWMGEYLGCGSRVKCRASSDPTTRERFNRMEGDLHNLWPTLAIINKMRSNYLFSIIGGEYRKPLRWCDFEYRRTKKVAEPRPAVRGEIARSIFYIADEYGLPIDPVMVKLLIEWNKADPPSSHEKWRNDTIEQLQGTRNKFIDSPRLGDDIE